MTEARYIWRCTVCGTMATANELSAITNIGWKPSLTASPADRYTRPCARSACDRSRTTIPAAKRAGPLEPTRPRVNSPDGRSCNGPRRTSREHQNDVGLKCAPTSAVWRVMAISNGALERLFVKRLFRPEIHRRMKTNGLRSSDWRIIARALQLLAGHTLRYRSPVHEERERLEAARLIDIVRNLLRSST